MNYTYKDIVKRLNRLGFIKSREASGSHEIRKNDEKDSIVTVPFHGSQNISKGVIKNIIKSTGLSNQDFHNL